MSGRSENWFSSPHRVHMYTGREWLPSRELMLSRIQAFPTLRFVVKMEPPLIRLCMNGDVAGVREAIEEGADVNIGSKTPLMWALWNHQNAVVDMLTEIDEVDVNCEDYNGATALHHAVDVDNDHGALVLLAQPRLLDVNHKNNKGLSALMLAVSRKKVKCATLLLDAHLIFVTNIISGEQLSCGEMSALYL